MCSTMLWRSILTSLVSYSKMKSGPSRRYVTIWNTTYCTWNKNYIFTNIGFFTNQQNLLFCCSSLQIHKLYTHRTYFNSRNQTQVIHHQYYLNLCLVCTCKAYTIQFKLTRKCSILKLLMHYKRESHLSHSYYNKFYISILLLRRLW